MIENQAWQLVSDIVEHPKHPASNIRVEQTDKVMPPDIDNPNSVSIMDYLRDDIWNPIVTYLTDASSPLDRPSVDYAY